MVAKCACGKEFKKGNPDGWVCVDCLLAFSSWAFPVVDLPEPEKLPAVLAIPLREYLDEHRSPVLKLWGICDFTEILLKFFSMIGVAEQKEVGQGIRNAIHAPMLGQWIEFLKGILGNQKIKRPRDSFLPDVEACFRDHLDALLSRKSSSSLVNIRNRLAHNEIKGEEAEQILEEMKLQERFENLVKSLSWLANCRLLASAPGNQVVTLIGTNPGTFPRGDPDGKIPDSFFQPAGQVALQRETNLLTLWPLFIFGSPRPEGKVPPPEVSLVQVFNRVGQGRLELTPLGSDTVPLSVSGSDSYRRFVELFGLPSQGEKGSVNDLLQSRIFLASGKLAGREKELQQARQGILNALESPPTGAGSPLLWIPGPAGIGKTVFMARLIVGLLLEPPEDTFVVPFTFELASPPFNSIRSFLESCYARMKIQARKNPDANHDDLTRVFRDFLLGTARGRKVLFLIDGLDEIVSVAPDFLRDFPLWPHLPDNVVWVCSGRETPALSELEESPRCHQPFGEGGFPPLDSGSMFAMVSENIGRLRKGWVKSREAWHHEEAGRMDETFFDRVVHFSQGIPLYVDYLIRDIREGVIRTFDLGTRIPPSLEAYHEELLRRLKIGTIPQIMTPIACHLALAETPLSPEELARILVLRNLLDTDDAPVEKTERAIQELTVFFGTKTTDSRTISPELPLFWKKFVLGNPSFREALETARKAVSEIPCKPLERPSGESEA